MQQPPSMPAPYPPPPRKRTGLIVGLALGAVTLLVLLLAVVALLMFNRSSSAKDEAGPAFAVGDCVKGLPGEPVKAPCEAHEATYRVVDVLPTPEKKCGYQVGHFELSSIRTYCVRVNMHVDQCYDDTTKWVLPSPDCSGFAFRVLQILDGKRPDSDCAAVAGANAIIVTKSEPYVTYCGWRKPGWSPPE